MEYKPKKLIITFNPTNQNVLLDFLRSVANMSVWDEKEWIEEAGAIPADLAGPPRQHIMSSQTEDNGFGFTLNLN